MQYEWRSQVDRRQSRQGRSGQSSERRVLGRTEARSLCSSCRQFRRQLHGPAVLQPRRRDLPEMLSRCAEGACSPVQAAGRSEGEPMYCLRSQGPRILLSGWRLQPRTRSLTTPQGRRRRSPPQSARLSGSERDLLRKRARSARVLRLRESERARAAHATS